MDHILKIRRPEEIADTPAPSLTIREVVSWYWRHNTRDYSQVAKTERRRILDLFCSVHGDRPHDECRPLDLIEFINSQESLVSDWTRKRWATTLQTPFNHAEKVGLIIRNPFRGPTWQEGESGRDLTWDEFRCLLRGTTPEFRRVLVFLRFSGARPEELRTAQWSHLNLDAGCIVKVHHKTSRTTKEKRPRRIELNHITLRLLLWLRRRQDPEERSIFLNSCGRIWKTSALCKALRTMRERCGMPQDVKLYGTRHAFATWAIINGVDLIALKELLGHRHIRTTERYLHFAAKFDHLQSAAEKAVRRK